MNPVEARKNYILMLNVIKTLINPKKLQRTEKLLEETHNKVKNLLNEVIILSTNAVELKELWQS